MIELDDLDTDEVVSLWYLLYESGGAISTELEAAGMLSLRHEIGKEMKKRGVTPADVEAAQDDVDMDEAIELFIRVLPNVEDHR